jgi:hypothetical protein
MLSANSDVESELNRLRGELSASAPKQLEGGPAGPNGSQTGQPQAGQSQAGQPQAGPAQPPAQQYAPPPPQAPPYVPPVQDTPPAQYSQPQDSRPAGLPVSDVPQDGDGS